jgi:septum formation protein
MLSLLKNLGDFDIILASESPRRLELLKMIGLNFAVHPSQIEETYQDHLTPVEYALDNAKRKSEKIAEKYPASLIISADTIVTCENEVLEKPQDERHAYKILNKLSGRTHEVITAFGICRINSGISVFDYEMTRVTFRRLTDDEIHAYIKTGEPFDKAGGYGAQGYGSLLIERVEGCYFNVVGLPLAKFYTMLKTFCTRN